MRGNWLTFDLNASPARDSTRDRLARARRLGPSVRLARDRRRHHGLRHRARRGAARAHRSRSSRRDDFASGTSSRSSRLIHGGVRYLEHGHLHLVFESSAERRRLLRLAPHLVRPLAFTWPVYAGARIPRWKLGAGLTAVRRAGAVSQRRPPPAADARAACSRASRCSRRTDCAAAPRYYDAATDDARLTLANAIGAAEAGAVVAQSRDGASTRSSNDGRVVGATVRDALRDARVDVRAAVVVNATGPWSDDVRATRQRDRRVTQRRGSKGAHIAVPRERIGNNDALTLLSPTDGRVLFVLPAGTNAIIGTTDTFTTASPDDVRATNEDVSYLLRPPTRFFPAREPDDERRRRRMGRHSAAAPDRARHARRGVARTRDGRQRRGSRLDHRRQADDVPRHGRRRRASRAARARTAARRSRIARFAAAGRRHRFVRRPHREIARETSDAPLAAHLAIVRRPLAARLGEISSDGGDASCRWPAVYARRASLLRAAAKWPARSAISSSDARISRSRRATTARRSPTSAAAAVAGVLSWDERARSASVADYASEVQRIFSIDS